ncbi:hypothetical protein BDZ90DRAFT_100078 [Jaminaea rosea]|uniref:DUF1275 domain protein n=1 Tax=Jaminaea rosea TaxID=1569628 RepID=A0A316UI63_9BASI|nr:hypothetical protein BDZ90DRAFT_100078 [Jaminaea rosea]PWN24568.1 hypothetical protein BDZ90DRAFT_100078 [Jaminaea rosea]
MPSPTSKEDIPLPDDKQFAAAPSSSPASTLPTSRPQRFPSWRQMDATLDHTSSLLPLTLLALLTGLIDGLLYSRTSVWIGFQTGNIVQFSMGVASFIYAPYHPVPADEGLLTGLRAISFVSFFTASWVGSLAARQGGKGRGRKRWFLIASSVVQALLLFGAAGILWSKQEGEEVTYRWFGPVIMLVALSMGLQSILSSGLSSPIFSTSVAYTATLTQLASDPHLFTPRLSFLCSSPAKAAEVKGRDLRILALAALALGGGVSQSLLISDAGLRGGLTVAAGLKVLLGALWLIPRGEGEKKREETRP